MTGIKAFVGHSFTPTDEAVVSVFLAFFDRIQALLDNFEWSHAKQAEPKELSEKVLRTIEDCNTLIAICTRKELATKEETLKPTFFNSKQIKADRSDFIWKTSDWVIQEIGLAIGRRMSVIVLLEEGCRKPGGLQGDVEYITFDRTAPERAYNQLLEMIKSLSPSAISATPIAGEKPSEEQSSESAPEANVEKQPDASWDFNEFESQFFWAMLQQNYDRAEQINAAFLNSGHAKNEEEKASWQAVSENIKTIWGKGGRVADIRACSEKFPRNTKIIAALAGAVSHLGQNDEAAQLYEKAAGFEEGTPKALGYLNSAAFHYMKAGKRTEAESSLERIKDIYEPGQEINLAEALRSFGENTDDKHLKIEAMEAIARINPDDHENRFSLAYGHAEIGNSDLALHHYLLIPSSERDGVTWNNLGVAYQNLSVPGRAVQAYKFAAKKGETLAMSNLAYRYMNNGFLEEAKAEIRRAMEFDEPHRNVGEAYAQLSDLPDAESKSVKETNDKAAFKIAFYRELSQAVLQPSVNSLAERWIGPKGPMSMILSGTKFVAEWEYQSSGNALMGLLASKPNRYKVQLRGQIMGRRAYGKLNEVRLEGTPSILGDSDRDRSFAIIFSDDLKSARVAENLEKRIPTFYDLRVADKAVADSE